MGTVTLTIAHLRLNQGQSLRHMNDSVTSMADAGDNNHDVMIMVTLTVATKEVDNFLLLFGRFNHDKMTIYPFTSSFCSVPYNLFS